MYMTRREGENVLLTFLIQDTFESQLKLLAGMFFDSENYPLIAKLWDISDRLTDLLSICMKNAKRLPLQQTVGL